MMNILLRKVFLLLYIVTICIGVQYECDNRYTSCGCGRFNVELTSARNLSRENAIKHSWPMIVFLDFNWAVSNGPCSGSILNNYFILTAARCVEKTPPFYVTINAGIHDLADKNATTRVVDRIHIHPNYTGHTDGYANDIALLELNKPLNFDDNLYMTPTCIPTMNASIDVSQYPSNGTQLAVIGWESIKEGEVGMFDAIQQGEIFVIDNDNPMCLRSFIDPEKQFCAGFLKDGRDPCYGDTGGPILQWMDNRWEQVGITSYSRCEIPGHPSIFTRLAFYIDWINSVLKNQNESLYRTTTPNPPVDYTCDRNKVQCGCGYRPVQLPTPRIIGGEDAIPNSWSMIVSIRGKLLDSDINGRHICGGTILNEWYILTAAQCVENSSLDLYSNITVAVGIHHQLEENQTIRTFDRIILHPLWNKGKRFSNDIALLHLSEPLDFQTNPFISRTCRPPPMNSTEYIINYPLNGTILAAIGWGFDDNSTFPEILQQVDLYSIHHNDSACTNVIFDSEVQFCAGDYDGRKSVCFGDLGGPILQWLGDRWEQVGITSYALYGCARRDYPPVFTRLASYYDWIEWNINPNNYTTLTSTTTTITTETIKQTSSSVTINSTTEWPSVRYNCNKTVSCGCGLVDVSFIPSRKIDISASTAAFNWPMIVSIHFNDDNQLSCAGTILTNRYILTAAHCVQNLSLWKIKIVPGLNRLLDVSSKIYQIDRIHQHPNYQNRGKHFENDIALLHLTESMDASSSWLRGLTCVPKINSPMNISQYPSNELQVAIIGWRMTTENQSYISDYLQQAELTVIDTKNSICSNSNINPDKQFCAEFEQDMIDSCLGDSGGPIFQWMDGYWDQVGILSSGECGIDGQASVYTRLAYYYDWMMSILDYNNETIATVTEINDSQLSITYQCDKKNVSCGCGYSNVEINPSRIMIGEDAVEASWTMFVSLRILNSNEHICGGTLLSNLHVLTAAHCVKSFSSVDFSNLTIIAGITSRLDSDRHVRGIRQISIHPNFTDQANRFENDIAILELDYRLLIDSNPILSRTCVQHVNSSITDNQNSINDTQLIAIGWETTKYEQSDILQQIEVFPINSTHPNCSNLIKDIDKQFCAGIYQDRKDPCQGDLGGVLFQWAAQYWKQVGIVSYGYGCDVNSSTKIYTRLSPYVDWINEVLLNTSLPLQTTTILSTDGPSITLTTTGASTTLSTNSASTTTSTNSALKHQQNIILSKIFIFIILIRSISCYL